MTQAEAYEVFMPWGLASLTPFEPSFQVKNSGLLDAEISVAPLPSSPQPNARCMSGATWDLDRPAPSPSAC